MEIITDIQALSKPAKPFEFLSDIGVEPDKKEEIADIISKLKTTINDNNLLALAAPQLGIDARIFCIKFDDIIKTFINPVIKTRSNDAVIRFETCASLPGKTIAICRPKYLTTVYWTEELKYEDNKFLDAAASIFMQMCELLDGIIPGNTLTNISGRDCVVLEDVPGIIAGEFSSGGLVVDEEDEISADDLDVVAQVLSEQCNIFSKIGAGIGSKDFKDNAIRAAYNNLKYYEQVISGKIIPVEDAPKTNRAQRRAANKANKRLNKVKKEMGAVINE